MSRDITSRRRVNTSHDTPRTNSAKGRPAEVS